MNPTLKVQNISKSVFSHGAEEFVVRADFEVGVSERVALWGPSGCGKTTLFRVISGLMALEATDQGKIFLEDREITHWPPEKRDMGVVFQEQALFPAMSVLDNVVFGLKMRGMNRPDRERLGIEFLNRVQMGHRAEAHPQVLSGGEKQRIAFLRALIWKPKILLLDEPFSALDNDMKRVLRSELLAFQEDLKIPILIVTHDLEDVQALECKRITLHDRKFIRG